jgi:hypothetical protein
VIRLAFGKPIVGRADLALSNAALGCDDAPWPRDVQQARTRGTSGVGKAGWRLFIALNAALFLRPEELVPAVAGWSIYQWLMLACLCTAAPQIAELLRPRSLARQPITVCVIGVLISIVLSDLQQFHLGEALANTTAFLKVVILYLLFVAVVNTPQRLRGYMRWLAVFALALACLSLLQYVGLVNIEAIRPDPDFDSSRIDEATGQLVYLERLQSVGIFGNPNDFARLLVIAAFICFFELTRRPFRTLHLGWLAAILVLMYALKLTYSRGGLLALLGGLAVLLSARFGMLRTLLIGAVLFPLLLNVFGGRQTDMDTNAGTARQRIEFWNEGFSALAGSPVFGIGMNRYSDVVGYVAHNSFVQCYVELGFIGGTAFTGVFCLATKGMRDMGQRALRLADDPQLGELRAPVFAIVIGYMVGMLSSTRSYHEVTYLLPAMVTAYLGMTPARALLRDARVNGKLILRLCLVSAVVFVALAYYARTQLA